MHLSAGLCALLASAATGLLVPSSVHTSEVPSLVDPYTQLVQVDCPGCKYAKPTDSGIEWTDGVENALLLNVSVGANSHTLELNGVQIYPPVMSVMARPAVPHISQVPAGLSLVQVREKASNYLSRPLRLTSWGLRAGSAHTVNESGEEVLKIYLKLSALEQHAINVPQITITALKNTNAQLMILRVEQDAKSPSTKEEACKDWPLLCKWQSIVAQRLVAFKGRMRGGRKCRKYAQHHPHSHPHHPAVAGRPHYGQPAFDHPQYGQPFGGAVVGEEGMSGHWRPHQFHGHHRDGHHKLRRIMHSIARIVLTVLIPILIGVCAGIMTYMLGMLLGTGAALLWQSVRGESTQYSPIALEGEEIPKEEENEKVEVVTEQYVDSPPVYVEVEAKEVSREQRN